MIKYWVQISGSFNETINGTYFKMNLFYLFEAGKQAGLLELSNT